MAEARFYVRRISRSPVALTLSRSRRLSSKELSPRPRRELRDRRRLSSITRTKWPQTIPAKVLQRTSRRISQALAEIKGDREERRDPGPPEVALRKPLSTGAARNNNVRRWPHSSCGVCPRAQTTAKAPSSDRPEPKRSERAWPNLRRVTAVAARFCARPSRGLRRREYTQGRRQTVCAGVKRERKAGRRI